MPQKVDAVLNGALENVKSVEIDLSMDIFNYEIFEKLKSALNKE